MRAGEGRGEGRRTANGLEVSQALAGAPRLQIAQVIGLFEACEALCVEIQLCSSTGRSRKDERNFSDKRPIAINNDSGIYKASESGSERSESERSASERSASERTEREREGGREGERGRERGERGRERERGREGERERWRGWQPMDLPASPTNSSGGDAALNSSSLASTCAVALLASGQQPGIDSD